MQSIFESETMDDQKKKDEIVRKVASIHNLPTELLVIIFSQLSLQDLSLSVARVCQRWKDALSCRTLWEDKEIAYERSEEELFVCTLIVAPCLKKVTILPIACENSRTILKAISSGTHDVREFHFNTCLFPISTGACILRHYKKYLQELRLFGNANKQSGLQRNLSPVLGQMLQLQKLFLSGYFDTKWDMNLLSQCTNLKHIDLSDIQDECDSYSPLLFSVKDRLKSLHLPSHKSKPEILQMVACCTELNEITLCLNDIHCIATLNSLESLHIKWIDGKTNSKMKHFIRDCQIFENLKVLTLYYIPGPIALCIAKRCSQLRSLTMRGIMSCLDIIRSVPSLESLCVVNHVSLKMRNLQELPVFLPELKFLNIEGCFKGTGIPPSVSSSLKKQLVGLEIVL